MDQGATKITTNHHEIREWAESRGGIPSRVKGTGTEDLGMIRIDFSDFSGEESLEEITWDEFFGQFEKHKLALAYQERTKDGTLSRFNKLVKRESE